MTFSVYRGEKRLSDLTTRLFGRLKAADARRASEALLAANPGLEHLERVDPGRPIVIPDIEGLGRRDDPDAASPRAELVEAARAELAAYVERLAAAADVEREAIGGTRELLESDELRRILDSAAGGAELHERVAHATEVREVALRERTAFLKTLRRAKDDLDVLFSGADRHR